MIIISPIRDLSGPNTTPANKKEEKKDETKTDDGDITSIDDKDSDADDPEAARKLADLKNRIIASGCKVKYHIYVFFFLNTPGWPDHRYYSSPLMLATMIYEDFKTAISSYFPKKEENDEDNTNNSMARETLLHRSYAAHKARFFAGREKVSPPSLSFLF